jgi:hypothetical protein
MVADWHLAEGHISANMSYFQKIVPDFPTGTVYSSDPFPKFSVGKDWLLWSGFCG